MDPLRQSPSPCSSRPSSPRTPPCEMLGLVGIEAVLDQLKIKAMKMGFEFNIMVVGQSGLGKSTMVNTLFRSKVWKSTLPGLGVTTPQTLKLHAVTHVIEEKGVKLKLTVIDTPGFGDQINNDKCWDPILGYINAQYEQFLQEELLITRQRHIPDTRVHCCVYFVPPTGHCLRPLDIEFLQRLCRTVNVVPVIARADSLTIEEREAFRTRIQQNLRSHCIDVYPQKCFDEDINDRILNSKIRDRIPFAVVGADREHLVNGKCVLGRKTKWGIIEVENMAHCEFPLLRDLLIRSHLQDLKDITHNVHYENYRVVRLNESHLLPRGPGWVNLAPASEGQLSSPGPFKVYSRTQDNPALAGQLSSAGPYKAYSRAQDNATSAGQLSSPRLSKAYSRVQDDATSAGQLSSPRPSKAYSRAQDNATSGQPSSPRSSKIYSRAQDDYSVAGQLSSPQPSRIYSRAQDNSEDEF